MILPLLTAVWLLAGDAPVPARLPTDPPAPVALTPVTARDPGPPAPLPQLAPPPPALFTPQQIRRMAILPSASLASLFVVPAALGARAGDWGTPATELLAGWGGGYGGLTLAISLTALTEQLGPAPDPKIGFNRGALGVAALTTLLGTPAATGASVWLAGEGMQGRSNHPQENLLAAMGGALGVELLFGATALGLHQPPGPALSLAFIPIAAGATIAYDLARGPHHGPRRAVMPILTVRF